MSARIQDDWTVVASIENGPRDRCVDIFRRPDGTWGFEEFRRDPEDAGAWTPVAYHAWRVLADEAAARQAAARALPWLAEGL